MQPQFHDDNLIVRYLLGELSEEEQTRLEDRAFSDIDYLEQVKAVEKDLIDEYARGELSGTALRNFERQFFASDERRGQVEFARALKQVAGESRASISSAKIPATTVGLSRSRNPSAIADATDWNATRYSWLAFWRGPRLAFGISLAAIALLIAIGAVLTYWRPATPANVQSQTTPKATPPVQETAAPRSTPEQLVESLPQPAPSPEKPPVTPKVAPSAVASLLLLPGTSRSAESRPQLVIHHSDSTAQLQVLLESGDDAYKAYVVALRTTSGRAIRSQSGLHARSIQGNRVVVLTLPATLLATGDYELSLSGITPESRSEPLGYYYFRVRRE